MIKIQDNSLSNRYGYQYLSEDIFMINSNDAPLPKGLFVRKSSNLPESEIVGIHSNRLMTRVIEAFLPAIDSKDIFEIKKQHLTHLTFHMSVKNSPIKLFSMIEMKKKEFKIEWKRFCKLIHIRKDRIYKIKSGQKMTLKEALNFCHFLGYYVSHDEIIFNNRTIYPDRIQTVKSALQTEKRFFRQTIFDNRMIKELTVSYYGKKNKCLHNTGYKPLLIDNIKLEPNHICASLKDYTVGICHIDMAYPDEDV